MDEVAQWATRARRRQRRKLGLWPKNYEERRYLPPRGSPTEPRRVSNAASDVLSHISGGCEAERFVFGTACPRRLLFYIRESLITH
eukprot:scaffold23376_cov36-Tisochrysis_lutea.AAC.1